MDRTHTHVEMVCLICSVSHRRFNSVLLFCPPMPVMATPQQLQRCSSQSSDKEDKELKEYMKEPLAKMGDNDEKIRESVRFNGGKLLVWPCNEKGVPQVGSKSMVALGMNGFIMKYVARWWCPDQSKPKTFSLPVIKKQVGYTVPTRVHIRIRISNHSNHSHKGLPL